MVNKIEFRNRRSGENGTLQEIAGGYRLRTEYGFSKWFEGMDALLQEWEKMDVEAN